MRTYGVPRDRLEFYPVGGHPVQAHEYAERRSRTRAALGATNNEIVFVQSGKQTARKKLIESLHAFRSAAPANAKLFIAGSLADDVRNAVTQLIAENPKVQFLGWKLAGDLEDLLCAADVYLQPGPQSVTMQQSLCCLCAVIVDDVPSHKVYVNGNGWKINDSMTLEMAMAESGSADLAGMAEMSFRIATEIVDYGELSKRVFQR